MRRVTLAITLAMACATGVHAQDAKGTQQPATTPHSCMMMSDSMSTALGLSKEQITLVKESDARCMKTCEKAGDHTMSTMDHPAMSVHHGEMKKILTADQYARWNVMCNMSKADNGTDHPMKN